MPQEHLTTPVRAGLKVLGCRKENRQGTPQYQDKHRESTTKRADDIYIIREDLQAASSIGLSLSAAAGIKLASRGPFIYIEGTLVLKRKARQSTALDVCSVARKTVEIFYL